MNYERVTGYGTSKAEEYTPEDPMKHATPFEDTTTRRYTDIPESPERYNSLSERHGGQTCEKTWRHT